MGVAMALLTPLLTFCSAGASLKTLSQDSFSAGVGCSGMVPVRESCGEAIGEEEEGQKRGNIPIFLHGHTHPVL